MRTSRFLLLSSFVLTAALPSVAGTRGHHGTVLGKVSKRTAKPKVLGQRGIDDARAAQLQAALAREGYLSGQPSGHWDPATEAAMGRLQADNGWQTKLVPDSRAIIKLGLGPGTAYSAGSNASAGSPAGSGSADQAGTTDR